MFSQLFVTMRYLLILFLLSVTHSITAQKVSYNLPQQIHKEPVRITFQKISSSSSNYYINYKVENTDDGILIIDRRLTTLEQKDGKVSALSNKYILKANKNKVIYNQFRVKSPVIAHANLLHLNISGLSYAKSFTSSKAQKFVLKEQATQIVGPFSIKVMEYNVYSDRVFAEIKCTFNGDENSIGKINLSQLIVKGGKANIVKKGDVLFSKKSYTFAINITPNGEEISVLFDDVLSVSQLQNITLDKIEIKSTTYKEPIEASNDEKKANTEQKNTLTELNFTDFTKLKENLKLELDNDGKPIEMAHKFLSEKGSISVSQIIELLPVFNLDGSRLKFAKMTYQFTSDKPKYHKIVGKLEYTKNKQALEEFLENQ